MGECCLGLPATSRVKCYPRNRPPWRTPFTQGDPHPTSRGGQRYNCAAIFTLQGCQSYAGAGVLTLQGGQSYNCAAI